MRAAAISAALVLLVGGAAAQQLEQRSLMNPAPVTVFEGMLRFASAADFPKLERSLTLLEPVLAEHRAAYGPEGATDGLEGLKGPTRIDALRAVRLLVARDVVVILRAVPQVAGQRSATLARMAILEWRLVEEAAGQIDLRAAHSISSSMRDLEHAVTNGDKASVRETVPRLEKEILALFTVRK